MVSRQPLSQPNFAVLLGLCWLLICAVLLIQSWVSTGQTLLDTDDAMRLVQMRAWVAGQGWYDLHQARVSPPLGFDSHWSRLVDAGLAGLLALFNLFFDHALAERLMRAVWPLLWLLPTLGGMVAIAWRIAGREAAVVALLLALVGVPAYQQFTPGRIDHHNVQIALTLLTVAATVWSDRLAWCAAAAGALTALALAIGFECLPYLAVCGAAFAIRYVADRRAAAELRAYALTLVVGIIAAFFVSVGPDKWMRGACDEIAINTVAAIAVGGLLLAAGSALLKHEGVLARAAIPAASGVAALIVFLDFEPRCIAGPYAMVDPAIWPIWLADVRENQPLLRVIQINPLTASGIAAFPAFAFLSTLMLARDPQLRRDFGFLTAAVVFLTAALTMVALIRAFSYGMWLGMPLVAALALRLFAVLRLRTLVARIVATLLLTPMALTTLAITIADAAGLDDKDDFTRPESKQCFRTANYAELAQLPMGLVVADVSFGPFLLALTPHSAMSAPYHRLSAGIVAAHRALTSPPDEAREVLRNIHADYVVTCGPRPPFGLAPEKRSGSLWGRLQAGDVPAWLEPMPQMRSGVFLAYRVKP